MLMSIDSIFYDNPAGGVVKESCNADIIKPLQNQCRGGHRGPLTCKEYLSQLEVP